MKLVSGIVAGGHQILIKLLKLELWGEELMEVFIELLQRFSYITSFKLFLIGMFSSYKGLSLFTKYILIL